MISQTTFRRICSARALTTAVSCSALVLIAVVTFYPERLSHAANHKRQQLTFEDRGAAQRAIEAVYRRRRVWPADNPQPKPPLDQALPDEAIRAKVEDYLRKSAALEAYWRRSITPDERQIVVVRLAARGGRGAIEFSDYPVKREVVDAEANVTPSAFAPIFAADRNRKHE